VCIQCRDEDQFYQRIDERMMEGGGEGGGGEERKIRIGVVIG
jgi:hypothetical protein